MFQSTHSLRSATIKNNLTTSQEMMFQSTHSLRSATLRLVAERLHQFVSIHALLAECDSCTPSGFPFNSVSIHALLAECDLFCGQSCAVGDSFNPRTPCGVRLISFRLTLPLPLFQSTHSLRSATPSTAAARLSMWFQSTHSLRSATYHLPILHYMYYAFQSTHSLRSATRVCRLSLSI